MAVDRGWREGDGERTRIGGVCWRRVGCGCAKACDPCPASTFNRDSRSRDNDSRQHAPQTHQEEVNGWSTPGPAPPGDGTAIQARSKAQEKTEATPPFPFLLLRRR